MSSEAANIIQETTSADQDVILASLSLTSLSDSLFTLTHMTALRLGKNALTTLPASISTLTALEDLDVSRNLLTSDGIPRYDL
jgi:Leucine-rich repeat (LRR) protein